MNCFHLISVILCTRNRAYELPKIIDLLESQETQASFDYEIIIVDNNSNDSTKNVVDQYLKIFNTRIRYFLEKEVGLSAARNRGIKESRGDILVFTDDDVIIDQDWLLSIVNNFLNDQVDCVFGRSTPYWGNNTAPKWLLDNKELLSTLSILDYGGQKKIVTGKDNPFYGLNFAITKSALLDSFSFNTRLNRGEDTDLFYWLISRKKKILYDPEVIVQHKISRERLTKSYFRKIVYVTSQNDALFFKCRKKIAGIPLWIVKDTFFRFSKYLFFLLSFNFKKLFPEELKLIADIGRISGYLKYDNSIAPY